jgi:hypothetical protein
MIITIKYPSLDLAYQMDFYVITFCESCTGRNDVSAQQAMVFLTIY